MSSESIFGPVTRPVGLETELGVLRPGDAWANPVVLASHVVAAYGEVSRPGLTGPDGAPADPVRWDYEGEDPLADLRGGRVDRAGAHPSQLTDDPTRPAPSGEDGIDLPPAALGHAAQGAPSAPPGGAGPLAPAPWGRRPRPTAAEAALPRATAAVLPNGARLYVDHAHPEYSAPETLTPRDALAWDRAGEVVARVAMEAVAAGGGGACPGDEVVLYKNNVDGKGAAYGTHENYLVRRDLPFDVLAAALVPFLTTRPVLVGAGRVGIGQRSERPGFQISQRADYVENDIGLETTFNRPVVNTRDEPHADAARFRRLHVINGDANRLDVPGYLKVATTDLLLWYLERCHDRGEGLGALAGLHLTSDPVEEGWALSHDTTLAYELSTAGGPRTGLDIQRAHLTAITAALVEDGLAHPDGMLPAAAGAAPQAVAGTVSEAVETWDRVLTELEAWQGAGGTVASVPPGVTGAAAADVEWLAKLQLCEGLRGRTGTGWDDPRLAALDIQWADLRPGRSVVDRLDAAGRLTRLLSPEQVEAAATTPPPGTRAAVRGRAVAHHPEVVGASWTSLVLDVPGVDSLIRLDLADAVALDATEVDRTLDLVGRLAAGEGH